VQKNVFFAEDTKVQSIPRAVGFKISGDVLPANLCPMKRNKWLIEHESFTSKTFSFRILYGRIRICHMSKWRAVDDAIFQLH